MKRELINRTGNRAHRYALIEAMGMQAENKIREHRGEVAAFDNDAFVNVSEIMRGQVLDLISYMD